MKAKPVIIADGKCSQCEPSEATHIILNMPGPIPYRHIPVNIKTDDGYGTSCWSWNGDIENPTLKPSIRTRNHKHVCHTFINDGNVNFLSDCTHELAGQTVPLLDVD